MQSFLLAFSLLGATICSLMGIISLLALATQYHRPSRERGSLVTFGTVCVLIALGCVVLGIMALRFPE